MKVFAMHNIKKQFYVFLGIILLLVIWEAVALIIHEENLIFPGPIVSFKAFFQLLKKRYTYQCLFMTLYRMIIGFSISFFLALCLGILAGYFKKIELLLLPFMNMLKAIPTASVLFLFLVIAGSNNAPIFVVILLALPVLYDAIQNGIANTPNALIEAMRIEKGNFLKKALWIRLPLALRYILVGITSSFGLAYKVEIMAEVLTGSTGKGIGIAIKTAQIQDVSMVPIFAWTILAVMVLFLISIFSKGIKQLILKQIEED